MVSKLSHNAFYKSVDTEDLIIKMNIEYAYNKYHNIDISRIENYLEKTQNVDIVLLDLEFVGEEAFCTFLVPILHYLKSQSQYWNEEFYNFDNNSIDDSALSAFEILPNIIESRFEKFGSRLSCIKPLYEFVSWATENVENFNVDDIVDFEKIKGDYNRLANVLRHLE